MSNLHKSFSASLTKKRPGNLIHYETINNNNYVIDIVRVVISAEDPGSGIQNRKNLDPGWKFRPGIRDCHPGSATLVVIIRDPDPGLTSRIRNTD